MLDWRLLPQLPPAGAAHQIGMDDGTDSTFPNFGPPATWDGATGAYLGPGVVGPVGHPVGLGYPPAAVPSHPAAVGAVHPQAQAAQVLAAAAVLARLRQLAPPRHSSPAPRATAASRFPHSRIRMARRDLLAVLRHFAQ